MCGRRQRNYLPAYLSRSRFSISKIRRPARQHPGLVEQLGALGVRVGAPGDTTATAVDRGSGEPIGDCCPNRDVELCTEEGIWRSNDADGAAIDAPRSVFDIPNQLHRAALRSSGDRAAGSVRGPYVPRRTRRADGYEQPWHCWGRVSVTGGRELLSRPRTRPQQGQAPTSGRFSRTGTSGGRTSVFGGAIGDAMSEARSEAPPVVGLNLLRVTGSQLGGLGTFLAHWRSAGAICRNEKSPPPLVGGDFLGRADRI